MSASETVPSDSFSLELYERTIRKAQSLGYQFPTVSQLRDGSHGMDRFLLLRHDIDASPRHALAMAELEKRLGVQSSYYVLMHSPYYNPAAAPHWDALHGIVELGFEVGLHYETDFFESRDQDPLRGVLDDVAALEKILGIRIASVSQHKPASNTFLEELNRHYVDAYNHDLMKNVFYISDSGFKWRGKSLFDVLGAEDRIHALIHPLTWSFGDADMAATYRRLASQLERETRESLESFIASTDRYLRNREDLDASRRSRYGKPSDPGP